MTQTPEEIAQLRKQLSQLDPAPFVELLADALQQRPTPEEWRKLAATAPDKFVKATKQMASVIGFSEKVAIAHSHKHHVVLENMNDSELLAYVREQRKALPLPVIEAEVVPVEPPQKAPTADPSERHFSVPLKRLED